MITRDQYKYLTIFHQRENNNIFSMLPPEILKEIYQAKPTKNSDISKALDFAADAEAAAVEKLLAMLDKDPSLLLQAGNVVNRGGNTIIGVTPYEFALGEGDPELAAKIDPYFDKIKDKDGNAMDGAAEKERQYNRYKPHIDAMQRSQAPYDLRPLFTIIQNSSAEDVTAALNKAFDRDTKLNQALKLFRKHHAPRIIRKPCMHYNYRTLLLAFDLLYDQWGVLSDDNTNYCKCNLILRQIIGYLQLTLPAIDRMAFAQLFEKNKPSLFFWNSDQGSKRSLSYFLDGEDDRFPDRLPDADLLCSGLGFDVLIFGAMFHRAAPNIVEHMWRKFFNFMLRKSSEFTELEFMQPRQTQTTGCVIC